MRILILCLILFALGCGNACHRPVPPSSSGRIAMVRTTDPDYARLEGIGQKNDCQLDKDCLIGGCSGEVCAAEQTMTTCEAQTFSNVGGQCGCVAGQCIWYRPTASDIPPPVPANRPPSTDNRRPTTEKPTTEKPTTENPPPATGNRKTTEAGARGEPCGPNDSCATGLKCLKYYGIAGPRGPEFTSCETPCKNKMRCPEGLHCTTIADGPGQVCR